jgi:hypothetical protein
MKRAIDLNQIFKFNVVVLSEDRLMDRLISQVSRVRIELRLLGQMLVLGIITDQKEGFTLLHNTLCKIVENDKVLCEK